MRTATETRESLIEVLIKKRLAYYGDDVKLELYRRDETLLHSLIEGFCPRQQAVGNGYAWDVDAWSLEGDFGEPVTQADLQFVHKAKLYAHGEEMTFRVDLNPLRFVGGRVFRLGLQSIGEGR